MRKKVLVLFGTRPEAIKLAPVIHQLQKRNFETLVISSSQHKELLQPFLRSLNVTVDLDLAVMRPDQGPTEVCSRVMARLDKVLEDEKPDLILVQGDTMTALAGALSAFNKRIAVGHVEAGLRSGDMMSPFPEEMNRQLISRTAAFHFAATSQNRRNLIAEGIPAKKIFITGNPVVDSLKCMLGKLEIGISISQLLEKTEGQKRILLTTHRRESFGNVMAENLEVLRAFVKKHHDVCLLFPVHPNPRVTSAANKIMGGVERVHLLDPLDYPDFLAVMRSAWLVVSDSGGIQEEAPSLGKPLLILRENTERREAIDSGVAKLIGNDNAALRLMLEKNYADDTWIRSVRQIANPFGDGKSAERIVNILEEAMVQSPKRKTATALAA